MKKKNTERRVYTKEFKAEAVALAEKKEKPVSQIARAFGPMDLGINENMLRRWMQASREAAGSGQHRTAGSPFPGHGRHSVLSFTDAKMNGCVTCCYTTSYAKIDSVK